MDKYGIISYSDIDNLSLARISVKGLFSAFVLADVLVFSMNPFQTQCACKCQPRLIDLQPQIMCTTHKRRGKPEVPW